MAAVRVWSSEEALDASLNDDMQGIMQPRPSRSGSIRGNARPTDPVLYHSMAYTECLTARLMGVEACGVSESVSSVRADFMQCLRPQQWRGCASTKLVWSWQVLYWMQAGVVLRAAVVCVAFASARTSACSRREVTRVPRL